VVRMVQAMAGHLPEEWRDEWSRLPHVASALALRPVEGQDADGRLEDAIEAALSGAGLAGDVILSPAQRRARGLVRRRRRRGAGPLRLVAAALGVVVLAVGTSVVVDRIRPEPAPETVVVEVTSPPATVPFTLEANRLELPDGGEFFSGTALYRGGDHLTGVIEAQGVRATDYYWSYQTAGPIDATPLAFGKLLYVGSNDGNLYALDQTTGEVVWALQAQDAIHAAPGLGSAAIGEGRAPDFVVVASDDGIVRAREAIPEFGAVLWSYQAGGRVRGAPLTVEDVVYVATTDGYVHASRGDNGTGLWRFPEGEEPVGPIVAALAHHEGVVYAGSEDGFLYLIDAATGAEVCRFQAGAAIVANPVIADGVVYVPTRGSLVYSRPVGACQGTVPGRLLTYFIGTPVNVAPAVDADLMYVPSGDFLLSIDLDGGGPGESDPNTMNELIWPDPFQAGGAILSAPVVAGESVYVGSEDGSLYALEAATGEVLWSWRTGNFVRASATVVDGVVFVASGDGQVSAVGGR
ncbi:MAG: PQQ-binding-like beta-propeller repeat protein, partial [Acidimicrobiia bacterium]